MPTILGEKISKYRKEEGLTLEALAKKIGSTKSYVWELENKDVARPSADLLHKIAVALNLSIDFLLNDKKKVFTQSEEDSVFFRKFQGLDPDTKKKIQSLIDIWETEDKNRT